MAEVLQALSNLVKDVESTSVPSVCGSSLLEMLAHNARNYLRILPSVSVVVEQFLPVSPQTCVAEGTYIFLVTALQHLKDISQKQNYEI